MGQYDMHLQFQQSETQSLATSVLKFEYSSMHYFSSGRARHNYSLR